MNHRLKCLIRAAAIVTACLLVFVRSAVALPDRSGDGDLTVHLNGGQDVAFIGDTNVVEFWIRNDAVLRGLSLGFRFAVGRSYEFIPDSGALGYMKAEGDAAGAFNLLHFCTAKIDNTSPDSLLLGGVAMDPVGLPAHSSHSLCYTMRIYIPGDQSPLADGFCIDNVFFPPNGTWTFAEQSGSSYPPTFGGKTNASTQVPDAPPICFSIVKNDAGYATEEVALQPLGFLLMAGNQARWAPRGAVPLDTLKVQVRGIDNDLIRDSLSLPIPVPVTFEITSAPPGADGHVLLPGNSRKTTVLTDSAGIARVNLKTGNQIGTYEVVAYAPDAAFSSDTLLFYGFTEGVPYSVDVVALPSTVHANGLDSTIIRSHVTDVLGVPVEGMDISVWSVLGDIVDTAVNTVPGGTGYYYGALRTTIAGTRTVYAEWNGYTMVSDTVTVNFTAGQLADIDLIAGSPRAQPPYLASEIRAIGRDQFGNVVSPPFANIHFEPAEVNELGVSGIGTFNAELVSYQWGSVFVVATDSATGVSDTAEVVFPPVALAGSPGVFEDSLAEFTVVIMVPPDSGYLGSYDISFLFPDSMLAFSGVIDPDPADGFAVPTVTVSGDTLTLSQVNASGSGDTIIDAATLLFDVTSCDVGTFDLLDWSLYIFKSGARLAPAPALARQAWPLRIMCKSIRFREYCLWFFEDRNGNPWVPIAAGLNLVGNQTAIFNWEAAACDCDFFLVAIPSVHRIPYAVWQGIDKNHDDLLEEEGRDTDGDGIIDALSEEEVALGALVKEVCPPPAINCYFLQGYSKGKTKGACYHNGVGPGRIVITQRATGRTLAHESGHYLSGNRLNKNSTPPWDRGGDERLGEYGDGTDITKAECGKMNPDQTKQNRP